MVYDVLVVGNGRAGQTFLFELLNRIKQDVTKSQNFTIAQIYAEEVTPACSLRTTATVSLSGIEEGISELGNELSQSFYKFVDFYQKHHPAGVEKVKQIITFSDGENREKMLRRYKYLNPIKSTIFSQEVLGVELDSYQIDPHLYSQWFDQQISLSQISIKNSFLKNLSISETEGEKGIVVCELMNGEVLRAHKVILCTGAYAKIFSQFYFGTNEFQTTQVVAGSYLEKKIDLFLPSIYLTLDGHNLLYRSQQKTLVIGSASMPGAFLSADSATLKAIYDVFACHLNLNLGAFDDFRIVTGLRHKAKKRRPIYRSLNSEKSVYMINGFYKNGFSFPHLCAERVLDEILG